MEGHQIEKSFDALQTSNYPTAARTQIVAIRPFNLTEGKLSLNAYEKQRFDLFFIRNDKLMCRYLYWEPVSFEKSGYLDREAKGWLGQVGYRKYVCPTCLERQAAGMTAEPFKEVPTYAVNRSAETKQPLDCHVCGGVIVEQLSEKGRPLPEVRPTPHEGLEEEMRSMVAGAPDPDVLPKLFGLFPEDMAPGIWTPKTEFEARAAENAAKSKLSLLPFREFYNKEVKNRKGMILLCKPFSMGPVDEADLYKGGRDKKDPKNVVHFQQILLGEPERRNGWKSF